MEPTGDRNEDVNNGEDPAEDKAAEQTPAPSALVTPRRGLRERAACRPRSAVSASTADFNGTVSSPQSSGRVLRDRSTRAVPAWLKDSKSDEDEDEPSPDTGASKRRKVSNSRRKKPSESVAATEPGAGVAGDTEYVCKGVLCSMCVTHVFTIFTLNSCQCCQVVSKTRLQQSASPSLQLSAWGGWRGPYLAAESLIEPVCNMCVLFFSLCSSEDSRKAAPEAEGNDTLT